MLYHLDPNVARFDLARDHDLVKLLGKQGLA